MSIASTRTRRTALVVTLSRSAAALAFLVSSSCLPLVTQTRSPADRRLSSSERVAHVLSRLTFGPRAGDAALVQEMGVDTWLDRQLHPESIPDGETVRALATLRAWSMPTADIEAMRGAATSLARVPLATLMADPAAKAELARLGALLMPVDNDFLAGRVIQAQLTERQLLEVMTDFWENHFSVYIGKMPSPEAIVVWDRDVIRPHALGKFRALLGAVAHSPAMLYYLDNYLSRSSGLNENYGRELLELHTLGVDGGYTQHDVIETARAFTGWTIDRTKGASEFQFRAADHDTGAKVILGHTLPPDRGIADGEEVLDILARHPATAHHIAYKLARRLVSDDPPPALVDRAAAVFLRTDGNISDVVRAIVTSPEFFSRETFRAKVKTPFELVVSMRRALNAPADTTINTTRQIMTLGQNLFGWATPEGWPDRGDAWINFGAIYKRIKFGGDVAAGRVASAPLERWQDWSALSALPLKRQVDGVVSDLLGGAAEPETRTAMLGVDTTAFPRPTGSQTLRAVLAVAFASPEFQRR